MTKHVVVTGTSTGLGRAIAIEAAGRGWAVLGSVRKEADRGALEADGVDTAICDVTDAASITAFAKEASGWCGGRLDALVNNAGTTYPGPVEEQPINDIRAQFEVNVFGQIAVTQALCGALRVSKGKVVMISSGSAGAAAPALGAYAASKLALEGFARALDLELRPSGVSVHVVRPGPFATAIWDTSLARADAYDESTSRYAGLGEKVLEVALDPARMGDPDQLARIAVDVLDARRPRFMTSYPHSLENMAQGLVPWWLYRLALSRVLDGTAGR